MDKSVIENAGPDRHGRGHEAAEMARLHREHQRAREEEARRVRLLEWDGSEVRYDAGFAIRINVKACEVDDLRPLGLAYSFVFLGPGEDGPSTRLYAVDNSHAPQGVKHPYDHEHKTRFAADGEAVGVHEGTPITVEDVLQLAEQFMEECSKRLREWGIEDA